MVSKPYIGITGFKYAADVEAVNRVVDKMGLKGTGYQVMYGATCSNKRLTDPESSGKTSPSLPQLIDVVSTVSPEQLAMVHYFTDTPNLLDELTHLFGSRHCGNLYANHLCRAVQLNHDWPAPATLAELKIRFPELQVVVQISPKIMAELTDEQILERSAEYNGTADYFLIDPSGGKGQELDLTRGANLLSQLQDTLPDVVIGAAGGFSPDNVEARSKALRQTSKRPFCVDAQGKLRTGDLLDIQKCETYLFNAKKGLLSHGQQIA